MANISAKLSEIHEIITIMVGTPDTANRYLHGKKLKDKIDSLIKGLVDEENTLLTKDLKKKYTK